MGMDGWVKGSDLGDFRGSVMVAVMGNGMPDL